MGFRNLTGPTAQTADYTGQWERLPAGCTYQVTIRNGGTAAVVVEARSDDGSLHDPVTVWNGPAGDGAAFGANQMFSVPEYLYEVRVRLSGFTGGASVSVRATWP